MPRGALARAGVVYVHRVERDSAQMLLGCGQMPRLGVLLLSAAVVGAMLLVAAGTARASFRIFTLAGASSQAAHPCWPLGNERRPRPSGGRPDEMCRPFVLSRVSWPAPHRHFAGDCLTRMANGTVLLCHESQLLSLSPEGFMRPWPDNAAARAVLDGLLERAPYARDLNDVDAAPDGSVMVLGGGGIARVHANGDVQLVVAPQFFGSAGTIAALPDGGAVVAGATDSMGTEVAGDDVRYDVWHLDRVGTVVRRVQRLPLNPRIRQGDESHGVSGAGDVTGLADGSIVLAQTWQRRVLRLDANGQIAILAGGGRGFREGARATDVDIGDVWAVARLRQDALLLGTERGLLRLDAAGRIHTIVRGGANPCECAGVDDPRAVNDDGRNARHVRFTKISKVDTLDGDPLALTEVAGSDLTRRLALVAPLGGVGRLAVALPRSNRALLRSGHVDIIATAPASARLELLRGRHVVVAKRTSLVRGRTRITLRAPRTTRPHVLRVTARTRQGAIAGHQLTVIPSRLLARPVVRYIEDGISSLYADIENDASVGCRPPISTRFRCTISPWTGSATHGVLRLRDDGLITFRKGGRYPLNLVYEPLTFNPRP